MRACISVHACVYVGTCVSVCVCLCVHVGERMKRQIHSSMQWSRQILCMGGGGGGGADYVGTFVATY